MKTFTTYQTSDLKSWLLFAKLKVEICHLPSRCEGRMSPLPKGTNRVQDKILFVINPCPSLLWSPYLSTSCMLLSREAVLVPCSPAAQSPSWNAHLSATSMCSITYSNTSTFPSWLSDASGTALVPTMHTHIHLSVDVCLPLFAGGTSLLALCLRTSHLPPY